MQKDIAIPIDLSYLHSVSDGDKQFEKILLEGAIADIESQVDTLQKAWLEQNAATVRNAAHSLKSVTAIAGLVQLTGSCKIIDSLFSDGIFHAEAIHTCNEIIYGWGAAKPHLEELILAY